MTPGPTRRRFLGAAAVVSSLPALGEAAAMNDDGGDDLPPEIEQALEVRSGSREVASHSLFGSFDLITPTAGDVDVDVKVYPHQPELEIAIGLSTDAVEMSASMCPAEARDLADSLLEAADAAESSP